MIDWWFNLAIVSAFYLGKQWESYRWRYKGDAGFPPREHETATRMESGGRLYIVRRDEEHGE